jgi:hypothetical protein
MDSTSSRMTMLPYAAVGLIVVGSVGTWVTFTGVAIEVAGGTKGGLDGDGVITLGLAIIAAILLFIAQRRGKKPNIIALGITALLVVVIAIIDIMDVGDTDFGAIADASVGWGLWMVLVGGILLIATVVIARRAPASNASGLS